MRSESGKVLNGWDSVAIIIAIVIGVGIFRVPAQVAQYLNIPWMILLAWLMGGVICLLGAFCYAELATSMPQTGGDYIYLRESYGPLAGFLFGWTELLVIRTGSIAAISFIASEYLQSFLSLSGAIVKPAAILIVVVLSVVNIIGLRYGKKILDILTLIKILVLIAILGFGFFLRKGDLSNLQPIMASVSSNGIISAFALALIPILWTYGGWHENTFVAGETKNATRILPITLLLGIFVVTFLYLAMNFLYLYLMPIGKIAQSNLIGADILQILGGVRGKKILEAIIVISSLGTLNATIITGSRITYALAKDHPIFGYLKLMNSKYETPHRAIGVNALWAIVLIVLGNFNHLLFFTGVLVWLIFALVVGGLFVLRYKYPHMQRPFKVWGYPVVPAAFILVCLLLCVNTIVYFPIQSFCGLCIAASGIPVFFISQRQKQKGRAKSQIVEEQQIIDNKSKESYETIQF